MGQIDDKIAIFKKVCFFFLASRLFIIAWLS